MLLVMLYELVELIHNHVGQLPILLHFVREDLKQVLYQILLENFEDDLEVVFRAE